jgi:RNA polymerase sigma factor (sigma-70 family)
MAVGPPLPYCGLVARRSREDRYRRIVLDHAGAVLRYVRNRITSNGAVDPDDIVSDVMTFAWTHIDDIPVDAELPWLISVARHRLLNEKSKRQRRQRIQARMRSRRAAPSAEDSWIADDNLRNALLQVSELDRECLFLTFWEGLSSSELAVALGVTEGAAAVRVSRAKATLLRILEDETGSELPLVRRTGGAR